MNKPTPRQQKLISGLIANAGSTEKTKSNAQIAREAGYTAKSATQATKLVNNPVVLAGTEKFLKRLEGIRDRSISFIDSKMADAPLNHLTDVMDKTIKNIQLLSGKATQNVAVNIQISEAIAEKNS